MYSAIFNRFEQKQFLNFHCSVIVFDPNLSSHSKMAAWKPPRLIFDFVFPPRQTINGNTTVITGRRDNGGSFVGRCYLPLSVTWSGLSPGHLPALYTSSPCFDRGLDGFCIGDQLSESLLFAVTADHHCASCITKTEVWLLSTAFNECPQPGLS